MDQQGHLTKAREYFAALLAGPDQEGNFPEPANSSFKLSAEGIVQEIDHRLEQAGMPKNYAALHEGDTEAVEKIEEQIRAAHKKGVIATAQHVLNVLDHEDALLTVTAQQLAETGATVADLTLTERGKRGAERMAELAQSLDVAEPSDPMRRAAGTPHGRLGPAVSASSRGRGIGDDWEAPAD